MLYPTTRPSDAESLVMASGAGVYVFDSEGKPYLDGMAGMWCTSLGYGNEEIIDCATRAMRDLSFAHSFGGKTHPAAMNLADMLSEMLPLNRARIFFGSSGSDANDTLMKLVRYHAFATGEPSRTKIIAREDAYHGMTLATSCLTGFETAQVHFQLPTSDLGILRTGSADYFNGAHAGECSAEFVARRARELDELIQANNPDTIAAMILEPVNAAGGVIIPPEGYFDAIKEVLNRYRILLWDDEVVCGFGRLGADFGANKFGFKPRMMTLAKGLSSAYVPLSVAAIDCDFYDAISPQAEAAGVFCHGYTYSGHPLACAVGAKVLEIYKRDEVFQRADRMGCYFAERLASLRDHALVFDVSHIGLLGAIEVRWERDSRLAIAALCSRAAEQCGLIVRAVTATRIAICPPLVISTAEVDELVEKLRLAMEQVLDYLEAQVRR